ncbi:hypothetical protein AB0952_36735 [Streptomyces caniferus]|uniref:hypothetical protein n=1 Tax=Streptomyces caniferus TaxID=285557 RepID=UPI0034551C00
MFSTNDRQLGTDEAFTNRQMQWEVAAAAEHLQRTGEAAFDVVLREAAGVTHWAVQVIRTTNPCHLFDIMGHFE